MAAREGCRTAVLPGQNLDTVKTRVNSVLASSGLNPTMQITSASGSWTTEPAASRITVSLSIPFKDVSWLGDPFAFKNTIIKASATMSSEKNE